jgi:drug/metabolite transporter (DMT)-like permease
VATLALVFINLIFGATFVVVKDAMTHVTPVRFVALRFLVAAGVLLLAALVRERTHLLRAGTWRDGALLGALLYAGYATQTAGLVFTTPAVSAFLTGLSVAFVPVLAVVLLRDRVPGGAWAGVAIALAGLVALTWPGGGVHAGPGELLTLGTALAYALHFIATAHVTARTPPLSLAAVQIAVVAALAFATLPLDAAVARAGIAAAPPAAPFAPLPAIAWLEVVGMGVVATALAFFLQTWAQRTVPATRVAVIFTLEPVFATLFSAAFFGERFGLRAGIGMALILVGMLVVALRGGEAAADPALVAGERS